VFRQAKSVCKASALADAKASIFADAISIRFFCVAHFRVYACSPQSGRRKNLFGFDAQTYARQFFARQIGLPWSISSFPASAGGFGVHRIMSLH
jgi:hypothetical protein